MKPILIDSGPMIALFDASDKWHEDAVEFVRENKQPLVTTLACVTETMHLLDFNRNAQLDYLQWLERGAVEIASVGNDDLSRIRELIGKYRDLPMDFADASLVHLAEHRRLNTVATIDRDFTVYRIEGRRKFKTVLK